MQIQPYTNPYEYMGSAFPAQPAYGNYRPFFRTDLAWWFYYDGTRWLTAHELTVQGKLTFSVAGSDILGRLKSNYSPYLPYVSISAKVTAPNDGSNYWSVTVRVTNTPGTSTSNVHVFDTHSDTAGVRTNHSGTPSVTSTPAYSSNVDILTAVGAGTPGAIEVIAAVPYRLITT